MQSSDYTTDSIIWWHSQKLINQKYVAKYLHVNLQVGIMGMKLFCERIHVTWTLQVHAHVVEINPQKTMSCCTCTDTCRVREHVPVQVRMLNLSILPNLYHTLTDVISDNIGTSSYIESEVFSFWASRPIPYCSWRSGCPSFCWVFGIINCMIHWLGFI
jgi:hypothetical protein